MYTAVAVASILAGCGAFNRSELPPTVQAELAAERRVHRAVDRSVSAAWNVGSFVAEARANPAECMCPRWEVFIAGDWVRAELRAARSADSDVEAFLAASDEEPLAVEVQLTRDTVEASTGWRYPVIEVVAVTPQRVP